MVKEKSDSFRPISIIFCNYNRQDALHKSLMNTMGQIYLDRGDEVLVADGLSTDKSAKMIEEDFSPDVGWVQVRERTGYNLNTVRNLGVREAANDLVVIMDADVIPQPGCIHSLRTTWGPGTLTSGLIGYEAPYEERMAMAKRIAEKTGQKLEEIMVPSMMFIGIPPHMDYLLNWLSPGYDGAPMGTVGSTLTFDRREAAEVGLFDEEYNGCWGYDDTDFVFKMHYSGREIRVCKQALAFHQPHKVDRKAREECDKRNKAILLRKMEDYKRGVFQGTEL